MSGLFAIVAEPNRAELRLDLERMASAMCDKGCSTECVCVPELGYGIGCAGLARTVCRSPGCWPAGPAEFAKVVAVFEGEPLWPDQTGASLAGSPGSADADAVAALYARGGIGGLASLHGHWATALIDHREGTLVFANDHFGTRGVFCARGADGAWLMGTHPAAILAHPRAVRGIDLAGLADYLTIGTVVGRKTLFQGIEMLPGALHLVFRDGQPHESHYWQARPPQIEGGVATAHLEAIRERTNAHVAKVWRQGGQCALALTGGMDSRAVLSALVAAGASIQTLNHSISGSTDSQLSAELARRAGAQHHFLEVRGDMLPACILPGVRALAGLAAAIDVHASELVDTMCGFTQVILTGIGTEYLRRLHGGANVSAGRDTRDDLVQAIVGHYNRLFRVDEQLPELLSPEVTEEVAGGPYRSVGERVDELLPSVPLEEIGMVIWTEERQAKMWVKGDRIVRPWLETRHPMLDPDLFLLGWRLPRPARKAGLAHRYMITRNAPQLADVPYERDGRHLRYPLALSDRVEMRVTDVMGSVKKWLGVQTWQRRSNYDYGDWLRGPLRRVLSDVLPDPRSLARPYFRPGAVRRYYEEHMAGIDHAGRLGALLALELTVRMFIERDLD